MVVSLSSSRRKFINPLSTAMYDNYVAKSMCIMTATYAARGFCVSLHKHVRRPELSCFPTKPDSGKPLAVIDDVLKGLSVGKISNW